MNDIEERLRRYQPVGPPPELRARALAVPAPVPRAWPWAAAAAVLLAVTIGSHAATVRLQESLPATQVSLEREAAIEELTALLGGGEQARAAAEWAIAIRELEQALENAPQSVATGGEVGR